jgi:hypothetical protein
MTALGGGGVDDLESNEDMDDSDDDSIGSYHSGEDSKGNGKGVASAPTEKATQVTTIVRVY